MSSDEKKYTPYSAETLPDYLGGVAAICTRLGGNPSDWVVKEVGDGNLNLVFIVEGPNSTIIVKQALPYVRLVATPGRCRFTVLSLNIMH